MAEKRSLIAQIEAQSRVIAAADRFYGERVARRLMSAAEKDEQMHRLHCVLQTLHFNQQHEATIREAIAREKDGADDG